jgi:hypothetical protein
MSMPPKIEVPAGHLLVETEDGYRVVKSEVLLSKTIAFRLPAAEYASLLPFLESFPQRQWGVAMRWLFEQPEVKDAMQARMKAATRPRRRPPA